MPAGRRRGSRSLRLRCHRERRSLGLSRYCGWPRPRRPVCRPHRPRPAHRPGRLRRLHYDIAPYYVQQHYDYPRFLCYDCHSYVSYPYWSPYDYTCVRFLIVVYDDPYYYPYRYYGGTRVVFARPYRPEPRFIFKDRSGSEAFITRVGKRPVNADRRREIGVRERDLPRVITPQQRPFVR